MLVGPRMAWMGAGIRIGSAAAHKRGHEWNQLQRKQRKAGRPAADRDDM